MQQKILPIRLLGSMTMKKTNNILFLIGFLGTVLSIAPTSALAIEAVASFGKLNGNVQVLRDARKIPGRVGLILNDKDVVVTGNDGRVTIIFRDGTEVRLFQESRFIIEKSEETGDEQRSMLYNFQLSVGSFWGRFAKGRQHTKISTPSATIGIKGTNVAFSQRGNQLDVALSEGKVLVENETHQIELRPGKRLLGVQRRGTIKDKQSSMPYQVSIKPDTSHIKLPAAGEQEDMFFTLQLIDLKTRQNLHRTGKVYMTLDNDKFIFPAEVELNKRGYARVRAIIKPFQTKDYKNGQLTMFAVMDGPQAMEVGVGESLLSYDIPQKIKRTIRVDMSTGQMVE